MEEKTYTDEEMKELLTEIGYDVDEDCLSELAIFEGFNWCDYDNLWR